MRSTLFARARAAGALAAAFDDKKAPALQLIMKQLDERNIPHFLFINKIDVEQIRNVIGAGGKTIRGIQEETGCEVEIDGEGKVVVA